MRKFHAVSDIDIEISKKDGPFPSPFRVQQGTQHSNFPQQSTPTPRRKNLIRHELGLEISIFLLVHGWLMVLNNG